MDDQFERTLLQMIDAFLAEPNGDQFHEFRRRINRFYEEETTAATRFVLTRYPDASLEDWVGSTREGEELEEAANEQLPGQRRELFHEMKECWDWTASTEPTDVERKYGWRSISDLLPLLSDKRREHRRRFGS